MSVMNDRFELLRLGRRLWFYEKCHEGADGRQDDLDDAVNARRHNGLSLCDGLPFLIPGKGEIFGCSDTNFSGRAVLNTIRIKIFRITMI